MKRARRGKRTPVHKEERKAGMIKRGRQVETEQSEGSECYLQKWKMFE